MNSAAIQESEMTKAQNLDQRMRSERQAAYDAEYIKRAEVIVAQVEAGTLSLPAALVDQVRAVIA